MIALVPLLLGGRWPGSSWKATSGTRRPRLDKHFADALTLTDRIVGKYHVRLTQERRSERIPSGLLVAGYHEDQME